MIDKAGRGLGLGVCKERDGFGGKDGSFAHSMVASILRLRYSGIYTVVIFQVVE